MARRSSAGDSPGVPGGKLGRRVDCLDIDDGRVRGSGFGADGGRTGAETPRDDSVVAVNGEEEENEDRDRDRHHPGAVEELGLDDEESNEAGRERAERR